MKLLVVAATESEVSLFKSEILTKSYPVDILITGAGMVPTAFMLGGRLAITGYDAIANVGVAGSFRYDIELGTVIRISSDQFTELGAEDKNEFITFEEIGLGQSCFEENLPKQLLHCKSINNLRAMKGITVNTVHGNKGSIKKIVDRVDADTESMEGAAVFYAANQLNIPAFQVRSISNYVTERQRDQWEMTKAIKNLNNWLIELVSELYT